MPHEERPPEGVESRDWLLLTNVAIATWLDATERIGYSCVRPGIESWHKILKSGCSVEDCRLEEAERLKPYLALMGVVAWRLFWLTHIAFLNHLEKSSEVHVQAAEIKR